MICPACQRDMMVVEYKGIELDYCTGCQGVWFDLGELALLKSLGIDPQRLPVESLLDTPEPAHKEKHHRCPICRKKMRKLALVEQPAIIIDACRQGDGLWFDGGELAGLLSRLVPSQAIPSPQQQIADFLREVFQGTQSASRYNQGTQSASRYNMEVQK